MRIAASVTFLVLLGSVALAQGAFVRVSSSSPRVLRPSPAGAPQRLLAPTVCNETAFAWDGQALPGGGTLSPQAFMNSATASNGRLAFIAEVAGSTRNQGVFWADAAGVHEIARGSGGGGGSGVPGPAVGDPTPIGGRFTGFFQGTFFAPAINALGDVLFMADVDGGSAARGLFLYRAATHALVKVAALGDASPAGGTLVELGTGALNDSGAVAFLANGLPSSDGQILRWESGVLTKVAEEGDPAPGGDTYVELALTSFGFVDGTTIPVSPPDINSAGKVAFGALTSLDWGFVLQTPAGAAQWYVRQGEKTPLGGVYLDFWNPVLNNADQIAFLCDVDHGGGIYGGGWMVGKPGAWRKALAFDELIEGAPVTVLGVSTSPQAPLADNGDLVAWCDAARECIVLSHADGTTEVLAGAGDATSLGGSIGVFDSWPSVDAAGEVSMSCTTPGATNGAASAHFVLDLCCPPASASFRNEDPNPASYTCNAPVLGGTFSAMVDLTTTGHAFAKLFVRTSAIDVTLPGGQHILCGGASLGSTPSAPGPLAHFSIPVPNDSALCGLSVHTQALHSGGVVPFSLSNAQDLVFGR